MIDALLKKIIHQRVNNNFIDETPTAETCWRSIILLGKNTASYKFALGKALLELNLPKTSIELDELALPFAKNICKHLNKSEKQITTKPGQFLKKCISYNNEDTDYTLPIRVSAQGGYEFDINPYDRSIMPRYSTVYAFMNLSKIGDNYDIYLSQEAQLGSFSVGLNQQFRKTSSFGFTNIGLSIALAYENFEFGALYNFPFRSPMNTTVYSPSTIELFLTFDFSPYLRNKRGDYSRLSIDNYY